MKLNAAQRDRACGVLLATAAGDALGAGYEFGPALPPGTPVSMVGGGGFGWEPGEWTDDTSMAIAIAEVAARGADLRDPTARDAVVARWVEWSRTAKDVGIHTSRILGTLRGLPESGIAAACLAASRARHDSGAATAGNGTLMRTAPVALAYLDDPDGLDGLVSAATDLATLTHFDPDGGEACALWCLAIRHAVLTGDLDIRGGLARLPGDRAAVWADRLDDAERSRPSDFTNKNGWVVAALQAAWSAIHTTPVPADDPAAGVFRADHLRLALENAVRGGHDTDTVAAIAGGLLGAAWGGSAVPALWRSPLHGWPHFRSRELIALANAIVGASGPDTRYPAYRFRPPVRHPHDDGVWLGDIATLRHLPSEVDAVVSLCVVGDPDAPHVDEWIEVRLIDRVGLNENPHLDFVLHDTVTAIQRLRADGRTVLLHCVQAQSRTPTLAALYGARVHGISTDAALADITTALPDADPNQDFRDALTRLNPR